MTHKEIQEATRIWLETSGAIFEVNQSINKIGFHPLKVDFLVINPYPFIIRIFSKSSNKSAKFQLANRLLISETFSPYLPIILVGPDSEVFRSSPAIHFADAIFSVEQLPSLNDLPRVVTLNSAIQEILINGAPKIVETKTETEIRNLWSSSLVMRDFSSQIEFNSKTLAQKIADFIVNQVKIDGNLHETGTEVLDGKNLQLSNLIYQYTASTLGGHVEQLEITVNINREQNINTRFHGQIWKTPSGKQVYIKLLNLGENLQNQIEVIELLCDAWLLRSNQQVTEGGLILLLHPFIKKVMTIAGNKTIHSVDPESVNSFSTAGWEVFPWDFDRTDPAFIKYLRSWSNQ